MATQRTVDEPTPNGGVRSVAYFRDDEGNPAEEAEATRVEIVEYDAAGKVLQRTYGTLDREGRGTAQPAP